LRAVLAAFNSLGSEVVDQLSETLRDRYGHLGITGLAVHPRP
jgi:hypothetical protein